MTAVNEDSFSETIFLNDSCEDFKPKFFMENTVNNSLNSLSSGNMSNLGETQNAETFCESVTTSSEPSNCDNERIVECEKILQNSVSESESSVIPETNQSPGKEEWLDIIGSGDYMKKVIKPGGGVESRPRGGDLVTVNVTYCNNKGDVIQQNDNLKFTIGGFDVIQGLDLAVNLMEKGEKSRIVIPHRLAYGKIGRKPDVPPDCDLDCEVELLEVEELDKSKLTLHERLKLGNEKRDRGNFYYERGEYLNAVYCYERAADYLDGIQSCSDNSTEELQNVLDIRIKVYNNMAATHLKLEAYDSALKSVEFVLKIQSKNVKAHFRKGKILSAKGLTDEAIVSMKTAASLEPETKVIQFELTRLINRKKMEEKSQKAMYKRMFGQDTQKPKTAKSSSLMKKWSMVAGGILAVAFGMVAYRQYHT